MIGSNKNSSAEKCVECGSDILAEHSYCLNCGYKPIKPIISSKHKILLMLSVFAASSIIIIMMTVNNSSVNTVKNNNLPIAEIKQIDIFDDSKKNINQDQHHEANLGSTLSNSQIQDTSNNYSIPDDGSSAQFRIFKSVPECGDASILISVKDSGQALVKKRYVQDQLIAMTNRQIEAANFLNSLGGEFGQAARVGFLSNGGTRTLTESDVPQFTINISNISLITEEMFDEKIDKRTCRAKITSIITSDNKQSEIETYIEYDIQPDQSSNNGENVISVEIVNN